MNHVPFYVSIANTESTAPLPSGGTVKFTLKEKRNNVANILDPVSSKDVHMLRESQEAPQENPEFPLWVGGGDAVKKQETLKAYKALGESPTDQKIKAAIEEWGKMPPDLQKNIQIRFHDNLWLLDAPFGRGFLIDTQEYIRRHLPANDMVHYNAGALAKGQQFKEKGYVQHMTSHFDLIVHLNRKAADNYSTSQKNNINLADFTDEQIDSCRPHLGKLLGVELNSSSNSEGDLYKRGDSGGIGGIGRSIYSKSVLTDDVRGDGRFWLRNGHLHMSKGDTHYNGDARVERGGDNDNGYSLLLQYTPTE